VQLKIHNNISPTFLEAAGSHVLLHIIVGNYITLKLVRIKANQSRRETDTTSAANDLVV
jgi:hypothetical protein